jgi:hypothetical protein
MKVYVGVKVYMNSARISFVEQHKTSIGSLKFNCLD